MSGDPIISSERETIEAELAFYARDDPPPFMVEAVERRIAALRRRLKELDEE
jgi:hypothetical protein